MEKNQTGLHKTVCPSNSYHKRAHSTQCNLTDWTFEKKKKLIISMHVASIIQCNISLQ